MITFSEVTKRYPDGTVAVDELSLEIPAGKITVFVGPSGCGKTTTLRMINRMVEPSSGTIRLDGENISASDPPTLRRRIGYVIQHGGLFPHRTVVDNVATVPYLLGWDRRKARRRAMELLDLVGLPASFAKRYPYQLSGGQQQRVGVARALAADPPVMLMDEPFSAVDPVVRKSLQEELVRLQAELHKTIVFVTHDIDEAVRLGDQVCVLKVGGRIGQYDTPANLLAAPADDFVAQFLGEDRGVRRLAFLSSDGLPLTTDRLVAAGTMPAGLEWALVVDADGRPAGWATAGDPDLRPCARTFTVGVDSLRSALDSAILNPSGIAVGVDADGRVVGLADQAEITLRLRMPVATR
ncbi:ABC transporter ATP-binding protein [Dactylosporangium sucinum]|uniref:ABC-type quaternary amine transporter n=1 Tax=Dactylosporangium sucinum TaxID=1424081 RepID=A0A917UAF2_9ACTN|nr:ABC transporter ATP-binding protein [Dactylosporangium sucinum]GGM71339.1 proline/glycine betaine ABC transporter ATP-binding protein [Dactylosporangium sucinum]